MREIKFRCWNKEAKSFHYWGVGIDDCTFIGPLSGKQPANKYEHQQFTGLHDKNGLTAVYEGDIIDTDGIVRGNVYESPQVYREGIDIVVEGMGTKAWRSTESIAMGRGCKYPE